VQGIYRHTRNPMYLGMTMIQLGIGAVLGNVWIMALSIASLTIVHLTAVRPEEEYLTERFGDAYVQYKKRVRRFL
jgi:protein-S-isoprenylcysteine O-methyltransferase Ste14